MEKGTLNKRIVFIDLMRAYAILMMVQGHLVGALLAPRYRNDENLFYFIWHYMTGITAPVFFFASGTVFAYLLRKQEEKGRGFKNPRVKKGFIRTLMLLGIGWLLQVNSSFYEFFAAFDTSYLDWFIVSHVLHVIGIAISIIVLLYLPFAKSDFPLFTVFILAGNCFFLFYPDFVQTDFNKIMPRFFANFFTKDNGSVFTIVPWTGFSLLGASFGLILYRYKKLMNSSFFFLMFITAGIILSWFSGHFLNFFYYLTEWDNLLYLYENNFLYYRLGQVLIVGGLLGIIARTVKIPPIITKIGSETLTIYFLHAVIIYGSITTYGLSQHFGKTLGPWECIFLALTVEVLMILAAYYAKTFRNYFKSLFRKDTAGR